MEGSVGATQIIDWANLLKAEDLKIAGAGS